jgi:hypothetical protein
VQGLLEFTVGIRELRQEMGGVASLCPGFAQVRADRPRGTSYLIRQRIGFLPRKALRCDEDRLLKSKCSLVNLKFANAVNLVQGTPKNNTLLTINGLRPALACLDL